MPRLENEPRDWKLDANGDLIVPIVYTTGLEGVAQDVLVSLRMWAGEWFRDLTAGLPLLPTEEGGVSEDDALLGQSFDEYKTRSAIRRNVLAIDDVTDVAELRVAFSGETRELTVQCRIVTRFGDTPIDVILETP